MHKDESFIPYPLKEEKVSEHINSLQTATWSKDAKGSKTGEGTVTGARIMSWIPLHSFTLKGEVSAVFGSDNGEV